MPRFNRIRSIGTAFSVAREAFAISSAGGEAIVAEAETLESLAEEEAGYRRLTASDRDLGSWDQTKMQEVAFHLYRKSHLAHRILGLIEDFVVGDGIQVSAEDDRVQEAIADFWDDPVNQMDRLNGTRVRTWNLWGEICLPVTESAGGDVRLGWIDPAYIESIIPDPSNGQPGILVLTPRGREIAGRERLRVIRWNDKTAQYEGECFFGAINTVPGAHRGISELYTAADWIDAHEEVLFAGVDRARILNSHIWDVTLQGMNQTRIDGWVKKYGTPPEPGSIRAHNEKVEWKALAPSVGAYEQSRQAKDLQDYTLGGLGIPSHWYGAGDDANLATASVMGEPARKMLKRKQKEFTGLLKDIVGYALQRRRNAGTLSVPDEVLFDFSITIPDFSGPDIAKVGASVSQLVGAVQMAEDAGYISKRTGRSLVSIVFSEVGAEIDPDVEADEVEGDQKKDQEKRDKGEVEGEKGRQEALAKAAQAAQAAAEKQEPPE